MLWVMVNSDGAVHFFSSLTAAWKCGVYYDDGFSIDDYIDEVRRLGLVASY